ncbi:MAG: hypothetical protein ABIA97_04660 [Candidatus Omnitrophota bacterium]
MKVFKAEIVIFLILLLSVSFMFGFSFSAQTRILSEVEVISIVSDQNEPSIIYVGSQEHVYKTNDSGNSWKKIFSIRKANKKINAIYTNSKSINTLYVLTQDGLYASRNRGDDWQRVFKGSSDLENNCLSVLITSVVFLGTEEGLFISHTQGKTWQKSSGQFSESIISLIVGDPHNEDIVYLACEKGIYITEDRGKNWKRIYITYNSEIPLEDYSDYDGDVINQVINIKSMVISNKRLYIATTKGFFFSEDKGKKWQSLTKIGLSTLNISSMVVSDDEQLYVATDRGIFKLDGSLWKQIGSGFAYKDFRDLIIDTNGSMLIAGKRGLYKSSIEKDNLESKKTNYRIEELKDLFVGEPTIEQVQKATIEFSETNINKIYSWRKQSRLKALFPSFSVGYDKVIYGSSSGAMAVGPRDWDLSLSWDVADLIWSSDQTSIDSRSRLTVQLRQDVLDQVTNLYFERRRLKAELVLSPPDDEIEELYRSLEIQQVTANIDGLTNNFFSKYIQKHN